MIATIKLNCAGQDWHLTEQKTLKSYCNSCKGERNHFVLADYEHKETDDEACVRVEYEYLVVRCAGCDHISFLERSLFSEDINQTGCDQAGDPIYDVPWQEKIYPPPSYRQEPDWLEELNDEILTEIMTQVYKALGTGANFLAAVGTRTALDRAIFLKVGDVRNFPAGWRKLKELGIVSDHEITILDVTVQAGHAAAHRGHAPSDEEMSIILDTTESLLRRFFILEDDAKRLSKSIPSRNKSQGNLKKPVRRKPSKRRFLHELGLPIGTELSFVKDTTITATIHDDQYVMFRGAPHSLSSAALIALREKDYNWNTVNGWSYWCHDGKLLTAILTEKDAPNIVADVSPKIA